MSLVQTLSNRSLAFALVLLAPLSLAACSDQYAAGSDSGGGGGYVPPPAKQSLLAPSANDPVGGDDSLPKDDRVAPDHGLVSDADPSASDDDPLQSSGTEIGADSLGSGPAMPTDHSHWLDGTISSARVDVELNHAPFGEFDAPVDKDITMHLRRGVNTVTFKFTPEGSMASANVQIEESEHDPPIPPLAVFSPPLPLDGEQPQPLTRTFTFIAH